MTKAEAEILVQRIAERWGRTHKGVSMWQAPGDYRVVVTHRASNTQFSTENPYWMPVLEKVR